MEILGSASFYNLQFTSATRQSAAPGKTAALVTRLELDEQSEGWNEEFVKQKIAGARMMFASLYPLEKSFLIGVPGTRMMKKKISYLFRVLREQGVVAAVEILNKEFQSQPDYVRLRKGVYSFLQDYLPILSSEQITFLQSNRYDYFEQLKNEYQFYWDCSEMLLNERRGFSLAGNSYDLQQLSADEQSLPLVITLQGMHCLGLGYPEDEDIHDGAMPHGASITEVKSRIRQLKGEEPIEGTNTYWKHRPFSISLASHFNNSLCGHSGSFPEFAHLLWDQRRSKDKGFLKESAYDIVREILSLDENLQPTSSKRILIDIRHMSPASRQDFYKNIIRKVNRQITPIHAPIPLIASQAAYSGIDTLDEMIKSARSGTGSEQGQLRSKGFLAHGYNLCDEDVVEIFHSNGLISLSLDLRLLGENQNSWMANLNFKPLAKKRALTLLRRTIEQLIRIPFEYFLPDPLRIWDILSISNELSGPGPQLPKSNNILKLETLEKDLSEMLADMKKTEPLWFGCRRPQELAYKICFDNTYQFVKKNY